MKILARFLPLRALCLLPIIPLIVSAAEYTYDPMTLKRQTASSTYGNNYAVLDGQSSIFCDRGNCEVEWLKDITEETDLNLTYYFDYRNKISMQFCEAAKQPPESTMANVWRLASEIFAGGASGCPINTGKYEVPASIDFKWESDEPIKCGPADLSIYVALARPEDEGLKTSNKWYVIHAASIWLEYTLPDDAECDENAS